MIPQIRMAVWRVSDGCPYLTNRYYYTYKNSEVSSFRVHL